MPVWQRKTKSVAEFGDFQTPPDLALACTKVLRQLGIRPRSIIEPTCGRGAFVVAAADEFPEAELVIGIDINQHHLRWAAAAAERFGGRVKLRDGDLFRLDWKDIVVAAGEPCLIIGNPPWVTSSSLGAIASDNLPKKSNFHGRHGIEAVTGKSNFDISEWMLLRYLEWLEGHSGTIAVLCKTAVARKILLHIWKAEAPVRAARIYPIDAPRQFGAAVDACFFVVEVTPGASASTCEIFAGLNAKVRSRTMGFLDGHIVLDAAGFIRNRSLQGPEGPYVWRSGIKHDCSKVMELTVTSGGYQNGLGETLALEDSILFPMLKSSDIGNGRIQPRAVMVVTQQFVGQETSQLQAEAPKTWEYLSRHAAFLRKRASVIYKNKPDFSIFGVGPYTFAPWKVAISGFYKKLDFITVGPIDGRPVVFDDTIYLLPCWSEEEAFFIEKLLRSDGAREFLNSMIHWDDKRPITIDILKRLSIGKLAGSLGLERDYARFALHQTSANSTNSSAQSNLFNSCDLATPN
jgi:methylase of polypeptide subunit release factors